MFQLQKSISFPSAAAAPASKLGSETEKRLALVLLWDAPNLGAGGALGVLLLTVPGLLLHQLLFKSGLSDWHARRQLRLRWEPGLGRQRLLAQAPVRRAPRTGGAQRTARAGKGEQNSKMFVWWPVWGHSSSSDMWIASLESGHNLRFCGQSAGNAGGKGEVLKN